MQATKTFLKIGGDSMDEFKRGYAAGYADAAAGREYQSESGRGLYDYGYSAGFEDGRCNDDLKE